MRSTPGSAVTHTNEAESDGNGDGVSLMRNRRVFSLKSLRVKAASIWAKKNGLSILD